MHFSHEQFSASLVTCTTNYVSEVLQVLKRISCNTIEKFATFYLERGNQAEEITVAFTSKKVMYRSKIRKHDHCHDEQRSNVLHQVSHIIVRVGKNRNSLHVALYL